MVCYQVSARFVFARGKSALVSTQIEKHRNAAAHLVQSGLPFGSGLQVSHFFNTEKEAVQYVSYLRAVYKNRIISNPPLPGGQLTLF